MASQSEREAALRKARVNLANYEHDVVRDATSRPVTPSWAWAKLAELQGEVVVAARAAGRAELEEALRHSADELHRLEGHRELFGTPTFEGCRALWCVNAARALLTDGDSTKGFVGWRQEDTGDPVWVDSAEAKGD